MEAGTEPRAKFLCYGVFKLPTGTLSGVVLVTGGTTRNGSITGGTGAYANARGVFTEVDRANDDVDVTIALAS